MDELGSLKGQVETFKLALSDRGELVIKRVMILRKSSLPSTHE
jgi:hypothetical protein